MTGGERRAAHPGERGHARAGERGRASPGDRGRAREATRGERVLEAPHRRLTVADRPLRRGSRVVEKAAVWSWRLASGLIGRLPIGLTGAVLGRAAQLSYLLWPAKRRSSNANFGHVLGLPPDDPRVRSLALAAYRSYGRYLAELCWLPLVRADEAHHLLPDADTDQIEPIRERSAGGVIFVAGHVGNNEAVAAAIAGRGWPVSVLADDSSFPELFEDFRRIRESWGVHIIPWRNIREGYGVLRRREMLGLLVDWGYRPDGIPVRLFDAWTTLPAGPATLAAKTGSLIVPVTIRRRDDGRFHADVNGIIEVRSTQPAELVRATQRIADALQATIAAAPEQWYSFKPIWPATAEESERLERRAREALDGRGPAATTGDPGAHGAPTASGGRTADGAAALEPGAP